MAGFLIFEVYRAYVALAVATARNRWPPAVFVSADVVAAAPTRQQSSIANAASTVAEAVSLALSSTASEARSRPAFDLRLNYSVAGAAETAVRKIIYSSILADPALHISSRKLRGKVQLASLAKFASRNQRTHYGLELLQGSAVGH